VRGVGWVYGRARIDDMKLQRGIDAYYYGCKMEGRYTDQGRKARQSGSPHKLTSYLIVPDARDCHVCFHSSRIASSEVAISTNLVLLLCRMMERYHVEQGLQCRAARGGIVRCVSVDLYWKRQKLFYRCSRLL
jgi:hypothetical protein